MFWLMRLLSVEDVFEVVSFLEWKFKLEWPREQNIKGCTCSINVARGYTEKLSHNYAHARALSAVSQMQETLHFFSVSRILSTDMTLLYYGSSNI